MEFRVFDLSILLVIIFVASWRLDSVEAVKIKSNFIIGATETPSPELASENTQPPSLLPLNGRIASDWKNFAEPSEILEGFRSSQSPSGGTHDKPNQRDFQVLKARPDDVWGTKAKNEKFQNAAGGGDTLDIHHDHGGDGHNTWGYYDHNGPEKWPRSCQDGIRQSPIDIRASDVDYAIMNELQFVDYDKADRVAVYNTGHGVQIDGFDRWRLQDRPYIYGGGLSGKYVLAQFHFHWSYNHDDGSEHSMASLHYPVEIHLVHTKDGYSANETLTKPDGLAVVAVFATVGTDGTAWATLGTALQEVAKSNQTTVFNYKVGVNLPSNVENFYRYSGSLTTPGCNEAVVWTVMAEPITITESQLNLLRSIKIGRGTPPPESNARPTQPLNGRRILYRSSTLNRERLCSSVSHSAQSGAHPMKTVSSLTVFILSPLLMYFIAAFL